MGRATGLEPGEFQYAPGVAREKQLTRLVVQAELVEPMCPPMITSSGKSIATWSMYGIGRWRLPEPRNHAYALEAQFLDAATQFADRVHRLVEVHAREAGKSVRMLFNAARDLLLRRLLAAS